MTWSALLLLAWMIFYFAPSKSARLSGLGLLLLILLVGLG